ncbi:Ig-like domain-containing protein [Paenibacillus sp. CC-CFT747]|nr:Ig-like domain-containing protein [Paenibacillus sp. CC-CFT747]
MGFDKWGATVAKAFSEHPDASFMVHVGDMVDNGFKEQEWKWWFEKAQQYLLQTTLLSVVGNHEVTGTKGNGDFLAHFNHPQNGLDSLKGSQYSFDYNNIHFVVLNSEYEYDAQKEWLRTDLANTDQRWKVIFFHRGPYGSIYDTAEVRSQWTPVFDEFGVDLVMNGHDHIYLRTHAMRNNEPAEDGKGTTYVIPGSTGPKFYELTPRPWQKVTDDENTQMYTAVEVKGSLLQVVTKTVGGRVVDSFELQKPISPRTIVLDAEKMELEVGESTAVNAMVDPVEADDKTVTWTVQSSSVEGAVTVAPDGTVTAHKPGTAVVRATSVMAPEVFGEVEIRVKDRMTGITLMLPDGLRDGDKAQAVTEAVYLSGLRVPLSEHVIYTSSNPKTAVIDNVGVITAVKEGETLITASFEGVKAEGTLTISKKRSLVKLETGGLEGSLNVGDSREISVTAHYSDNSSEVVTAGVTFASESPNVAKIDDQGVLLAVANGHAVITIQYKGKRETISIWVGKQETRE